MPTLSGAHIHSILEISGLAAECAEQTGFPRSLMRDMTDLFASRSCVYYSMSGDLDNRPIWNGFGYNVSAEPVKDYESHYRSLDPCFRGLKRRAANGRPLVVSTDQVIASERTYVGSGYYRDFLYPQHIHSSIIFAVGDQRGLLGLFGFHRAPGRPHYGAREHLKARLFASQMAGALRMRTLSSDLANLRKLADKLQNEGLVSEARLEEFGITPRERQIVRQVSQGLTTAQIADRLDISEKTVEQHLDHLYRKTSTTAAPQWFTNSRTKPPAGLETPSRGKVPNPARRDEDALGTCTKIRSAEWSKRGGVTYFPFGALSSFWTSRPQGALGTAPKGKYVTPTRCRVVRCSKQTE